MASDAPLTNPKHLRPILDIEADRQIGSPLFQRLPPEVRARIWALAVANTADAADASKRYRNATPYTRPGFTGPLRTHTALLQTCRAVFQEAWFLPASCFEYAEWVTPAKHTPPGHMPSETAGPRRTVDQLPKEGRVGALRFFAEVRRLDRVFPRTLWWARTMSPRRLTITLRHVDWTGWQKDEPLRLGGSWAVEFGEHVPSTVEELYLELETSARKASQARELAAQMLEKWFVVRTDCGRMFPDRVEENRWRGTSAWNRRRWTREEVAPMVMEHVVYAVRFRNEQDMSASELARISKVARANAEARLLCECEMLLSLPGLEAPENPGMPSPCPGSVQTIAPTWTQLPRVVMEGKDETNTDEVDKQEKSCRCTTPPLRIPHPDDDLAVLEPLDWRDLLGHFHDVFPGGIIIEHHHGL